MGNNIICCSWQILLCEKLWREFYLWRLISRIQVYPDQVKSTDQLHTHATTYVLLHSYRWSVPFTWLVYLVAIYIWLWWVSWWVAVEWDALDVLLPLKCTRVCVCPVRWPLALLRTVFMKYPFQCPRVCSTAFRIIDKVTFYIYVGALEAPKWITLE